MDFCSEKHTDPFTPPVRLSLEYLTGIFHSGIGYSAVNTGRSALACFITIATGLPIRKHWVARLLRVFSSVNQRYPGIQSHMDHFHCVG